MALVPVDGGGGNVNGDFRILSQTPDLLVQTGGKVVDAVTVAAVELAYNVQFGFTVAKNTWQGALFETNTRVIAADIQTIAQHPHVVAIYGAPDTDLNGLLHDYLFVTVGIDGTDSTAEVKLLQETANTTSGYTQIDKAYDTLVKNQNAGS